MAASWIVAKTQPNREAWAGENIKRLGYNFYLPKFIRTVGEGKRRQEKISCLFPSYIFVLTDGQWRFLNGTWGISHVILFGETPATLSQREIDGLRAGENDRGLLKLPVKTFSPGDRVQVQAGPFINEIGIYQESTVQERAAVLLNILGRKVRATIAENCLACV